MSRSGVFALVITALAVLGQPLAAAPPGQGKEGGKEGPPASLVVTAPVEERVIVPTVIVNATIIPQRESEIAARVAGSIARVLVEVGDRVEADQPLLELNRREAELEVITRTAERVEAQARLEKAQQDLAQDRTLRGTDAISRRALALSTMEEATRQALADKAQAQLELAHLHMEWHTITAPFAGVVTKRLVELGEWIDKGKPVAALVSPGLLEVEAQLADRLADRLAATANGAQPVTAQLQMVGQREPFAVSLRAVVPRTDPVSRNRPTFWRLPADTRVVAGQEALLTIPVGEPRPLVLVPKDAVVRDLGRVLVYAVTPESTARAVNVTLGPAVEGFFQLEGGELKPGEAVVVRGNERLRPDQKIRLAPPAGAGSAAP